jgi:hypothetical protein
VIGVINSALQKDPGSIFITNSAEQVAVIASVLVAAMLVWVGDYYRSISRRDLSDLYELHELSTALAVDPEASRSAAAHPHDIRAHARQRAGVDFGVRRQSRQRAGVGQRRIQPGGARCAA